MNYYNPYFYTMPNAISTKAGSGLFSRLFGGITFSRFIDGTQKALNFANQAIPFVKQVKPMIGNARTMFKVLNEFKKSEKPKYEYVKPNSMANASTRLNDSNSKSTIPNNNGPPFFM